MLCSIFLACSRSKLCFAGDLDDLKIQDLHRDSFAGCDFHDPNCSEVAQLMAVSTSIELPTLRKDFVVELYQVFRAATAGASAVLLIAELLDGSALKEFVEAAHSVGLDALVEFHRPELLVSAVESGSGIVGINNRNLDTMDVDVELSLIHI